MKKSEYETNQRFDVRKDFQSEPRKQTLVVGAEATRKAINQPSAGVVSITVGETVTVTNNYNF